MKITSDLKRYWIAFSALILIGGSGFAQEITLTGIGLTGSLTGLDAEIRPGDSIYVIVSYEADAGLDVRGVSVGEVNPNRIRLFFYDSAVPRADSLVSNALIEVDSAAVEIDNISNPHMIRFGIQSPAGLSSDIISLQMQLGLYAVDGSQEIIYSSNWVSHANQGGSQATKDPINAGHTTYLRVSHDVDNRPVIHSPANGDTVGRYLTVNYDLPVNAQPGTLTLQFAGGTSLGNLLYHTCYLSRTQRGNNISLDLDLRAMHISAGVDSVVGLASLFSDTLYQIRMGYVLQDGRLSDSAFVQITADLVTESVTLINPTLGTSAPYPDIPVLYRLAEAADTVWMIFEWDSLASPPDTVDLLSPHILTLATAANAAGLHDFTLAGNDIGWANEWVEFSNHGPQDSLKRRAVYNVTIQYGDRFGNSIVSAATSGYIWPEDNVTIRPSISHPANYTADNRSLWVEFTIPETPRAGSVYMSFVSLETSVYSTVLLGNLASAGSVGFMLNALSLDHSGPPVTGVDGNPFLVDGDRYQFRVYYQDQLENPTSFSTSILDFDDSTEPPVVSAPLDGDTLHLYGINAIFSQPEYSIPGTAQLVLTQSGGEEVDLLSPRILYLSDTAIATADNPREITIQPAFLNAGAGIDSVKNGGSLLRRATYDMTVRYQDTLSNAVGEYTVRNLYFPSGSSVTVYGSKYPVDIQQNVEQREAFMLSVKAEGESSLRSIEFDVEGTVVYSDIRANRVILWQSVDSLFSPEQDTPIDTLDFWYSGPMRFDSLALPLSQEETYFLLTLAFTAQARTANSIELVLRNAGSIDCGGDPVWCLNCPIGGQDTALNILLTRLFTEQYREFGALKLVWDVASEFNNEGFNVWRRQEMDTVFARVASFTEYPELYGRGSAPSAKRYQYVDRNLIPGETYYYRLETVSTSGFETQMVDFETSGSPQLPPDNFMLKDAYPNPFNPETTVEYVVPYVAEVRITIYNILGHQIRELVRAQLAPAVYQTIWDGSDDNGMSVPSGVYFYQMVGSKGAFRDSRKVLLIR